MAKRRVTLTTWPLLKCSSMKPQCHSEVQFQELRCWTPSSEEMNALQLAPHFIKSDKQTCCMKRCLRCLCFTTFQRETLCDHSIWELHLLLTLDSLHEQVIINKTMYDDIQTTNFFLDFRILLLYLQWEQVLFHGGRHVETLCLQ